MTYCSANGFYGKIHLVLSQYRYAMHTYININYTPSISKYSSVV